MHLQMNWPRRLTWWVTGRQVCAKCINLHHSTAATNAESCRPFFAAHQHPGPLMLARVQNTSVKNNNSNNSWLPRCIHFFAAAHNACIEIQATRDSPGRCKVESIDSPPGRSPSVPDPQPEAASASQSQKRRQLASWPLGQSEISRFWLLLCLPTSSYLLLWPRIPMKNKNQTPEVSSFCQNATFCQDGWELPTWVPG